MHGFLTFDLHNVNKLIIKLHLWVDIRYILVHPYPAKYVSVARKKTYKDNLFWLHLDEDSDISACYPVFVLNLMRTGFSSDISRCLKRGLVMTLYFVLSYCVLLWTWKKCVWECICHIILRAQPAKSISTKTHKKWCDHRRIVKEISPTSI